MDSLLEFGVKRARPRRRSPVRRSPVRRKKTSPVRRKRSPPRKCNQQMTLARLRKIAMENDVNIYSEARTAINKRTGEPKKPKMVGCSTLMKRMNEAGLGQLYKVRQVMNPESYLEQEDFDDEPNMIDLMQSQPSMNIMDQQIPMSQPGVPVGPVGPGVPVGPVGPLPTMADVLRDNPRDCAAGFGTYRMSYGRYTAGARPKMSQKHVGKIMVNGRPHLLFEGVNGGVYYMKGKSGTKIYLPPQKRKRSPKRKQRR